MPLIIKNIRSSRSYIQSTPVPKPKKMVSVTNTKIRNKTKKAECFSAQTTGTTNDDLHMTVSSLKHTGALDRNEIEIAYRILLRQPGSSTVLRRSVVNPSTSNPQHPIVMPLIQLAIPTTTTTSFKTTIEIYCFILERIINNIILQRAILAQQQSSRSLSALTTNPSITTTIEEVTDEDLTTQQTDETIAQDTKQDNYTPWLLQYKKTIIALAVIGVAGGIVAGLYIYNPILITSVALATKEFIAIHGAKTLAEIQMLGTSMAAFAIASLNNISSKAPKISSFTKLDPFKKSIYILATLFIVRTLKILGTLINNNIKYCFRFKSPEGDNDDSASIGHGLAVVATKQSP